MTAVKKFLFDTFRSFDEPEEEEAVEEIVEEVEEVEELAPTFSEEQMAAAREESFAAGKEKGINETAASIEQKAMETLGVVESRLENIFQIQEEANAALTRDGLRVAATVVRRIFPNLNQEHAQKEVDELISTAMGMLTEEPRVVINVNEQMHAPLAERIRTLVGGKGFEGKLTLTPDPAMAPGDCKIEWGSGSAERDIDALWREIDAIIERNLGPIGQAPMTAKAAQSAEPALAEADHGMPNDETGASAADGAADEALEAPLEVIQEKPDNASPSTAVAEGAEARRDTPDGDGDSTASEFMEEPDDSGGQEPAQEPEATGPEQPEDS
ncbi:MAG: FliH/SctL family protein [Rhodospirillales bacterium]